MFFKWYYLLKTRVIYQTDYGFVFQNQQSTEFYVHEDNYVADIRTLGMELTNFAFLQITMNNKVDTYNRSYTKLQSVLANIGGVINSILTLFV